MLTERGSYKSIFFFFRGGSLDIFLLHIGTSTLCIGRHAHLSSFSFKASYLFINLYCVAYSLNPLFRLFVGFIICNAFLRKNILKIRTNVKLYL